MLSSKTGALEPDNPTLRNKPQHTVTPSTEDHHGYLGTLQVERNSHQQDIAAGDAQARKLYSDIDKLYKTVDKYDRHIGHVLAASAFRTVQAPKYATDKKTGGALKPKPNDLHFTLDWSLIRTQNATQRKPINRLPNVRPPSTPGTTLFPRKPCNTWSSFDVQRDLVDVAKFGRTTGWTFGKINSMLIRINTEIPEFSDMAKLYGLTPAQSAYCFEVIPNPRGKSFMQEGDSGSILVHDGSGAWLGLLFGATGNDYGMFIPIDLVFQDIKRITGRDVVSPSFIQPEKVGLAKRQLTPSE